MHHPEIKEMKTHMQDKIGFCPARMRKQKKKREVIVLAKASIDYQNVQFIDIKHCCFPLRISNNLNGIALRSLTL